MLLPEEGSLTLVVTPYVLEELKRTLEDERIVAKSVLRLALAPSEQDSLGV